MRCYLLAGHPHLFMQPFEEGRVVCDIHGRLVNAGTLPQERFHRINVSLILPRAQVALGAQDRGLSRHAPRRKQFRSLGTGSFDIEDLAVFPNDCSPNWTTTTTVTATTTILNYVFPMNPQFAFSFSTVFPG